MGPLTAQGMIALPELEVAPHKFGPMGAAVLRPPAHQAM